MSNYYQPNRSKYRNTVVEYDGYKFDSKGERDRYVQLKLLERAGVISDLQVHVPFQLVPKDGKERAICYEADFVYMEKGERVVEDFKGYKTDVYKIKRRLMKWILGIVIRETSDKDLR